MDSNTFQLQVNYNMVWRWPLQMRMDSDPKIDGSLRKSEVTSVEYPVFNFNFLANIEYTSCTEEICYKKL